MAERNPQVPHSIQSLLYVEWNGNYCGYKPELITGNISTDLGEFLICGECKGVCRRAMHVGRKLICGICVTGKKRNVDKRVENKVASLNSKCPLTENGCTWAGVLGRIEEHMTVCPRLLIECQFKCGIVSQRETCKKHSKEVCQLRKIKCYHCNQQLQAFQNKQHLRNCNNHPDTEVQCPYKEFGCDVIAPRKNMDIHLTENMIGHQKLMLDQLNPLRERKEQLERLNEQQKIRNQRQETVNNHQEIVNHEQEIVNNEQETMNNGQEQVNNQQKIVIYEIKRCNEAQAIVNALQKKANHEQERLNEQQRNRNHQQEQVNNQQEIVNYEHEVVKYEQEGINNRQENRNGQQKIINLKHAIFNERQRIIIDTIETSNVTEAENKSARRKEKRWRRICVLLGFIVTLLAAVIGIALAVSQQIQITQNSQKIVAINNRPVYLNEYIPGRNKVLPGIEWIHNLKNTGYIYGATFYLAQCKLRPIALVENTYRGIYTQYLVERLNGEYNNSVGSCRISYSYATYGYLDDIKPTGIYSSVTNVNLDVGGNYSISVNYWEYSDREVVVRAYFDTEEE